MSALILTLDIPPRGDFRLSKPGAAAPTGFVAIDRDWLVRSQVMASHHLEMRHSDNDDALRLAHSGGKPAAPVAERLVTQWRTAMAGMTPDPRPTAPALPSGQVPGGLLPALEDEHGRARQLARYQEAWIKAAGSGLDPARPFEHRLLQHLATLEFPSPATLRLRHGEDNVTLYMQEKGPLERLLDRIRIKTFRSDPKSCELYFDRATAPLMPDRAALLVARSRAVQIATLAVALGVARAMPLRVLVTHGGLDGEMVRLQLDLENRAGALGRLGRVLSNAAGLPTPGASLPRARPLNEADLSPDGAELVLLDPATAAATVATFDHQAETATLRRLHPVAWQAERRDGLPARVYAGDDPSVHPRLGLLPFAMISGGNAAGSAIGERPTMQGLSNDEAEALRKWLNGVRGTYGFRPVFGHLYLQGLEYRLLVDGAAPDEARVLRNEIAAIAELAEAPEDLAASARALLDWLAATGKHPLGPPADEGRLGALVALGELVNAGQPLDAQQVWAYVRHYEPDLAARGRERFASRFAAIFPKGLLLRPIGITLNASYTSLSGLCDLFDVPLGKPHNPLPDLRTDQRLYAALRRIQAAM